MDSVPEQRSDDVTPGAVYQTAHGPSLYVRTEQRPGVDHPQHLFVHVDRRVVFHRWTDTVPPEAELIVDTEGREQANDALWLLAVAEHNNDILLGLLRQACAWLPRERAGELRRRYVDAQPPK